MSCWIRASDNPVKSSASLENACFREVTALGGQSKGGPLHRITWPTDDAEDPDVSYDTGDEQKGHRSGGANEIHAEESCSSMLAVVDDSAWL
mmetsp:Transcript_27389/g.60309  ORF Transcript_27389/g.60309 Transcript_27389/m.60309 type:complete len:92 (-) Transcript_27389:891-1166(-)